MKIQDMPAGPEMDRLVAEKAMGWTPHARNSAFFVPVSEEHELMGTHPVLIRDWRPSQCIEYAWMAVERLRSAGFSVSITADSGEDGAWVPGVWRVEFGDFIAKDKSLQLAICRAALIAVGCEVVQ